MLMAMQKYVGIDFGTTNSAIAVANEDGTVSMAHFPTADTVTETYRSAIYFEQHRENSRRYTRARSGPEAVVRYLASEEKGRFIQSLKAFLPNTLVKCTTIFGTTYQLEDMISLLVRQLLEKSENSLGELGRKAVVGRPVRFSSSESVTDDELAMERLRAALVNAGIPDTTFEYEPVAAAYYYESLLDCDELILIADFGGGSSDFSLLHAGPSFRKRQVPREILGSEGVALAGDAFDAKMVRYMVSPLLGQESLYRSMGKLLQMPAWIYTRLERWHHLSFLKSKETIDILHALRAQSLEPEKVQNLIDVVDGDLGLHLHQAVQRTKIALSTQESTIFSFQAPGISISQRVTRQEFEEWIRDELDQISCCIDRLLNNAGVDSRQVDRVFLTGGSSFVSAVHRIFVDRFGPERLSSESEFTAVAKGLALRALDLSVTGSPAPSTAKAG